MEPPAPGPRQEQGQEQAPEQGTGRRDPEAIADRLHSAAIHLLRRLATEDARSGLSAARLSALSVIVHAGPLTLGALATAERVRPSTISNTVAGLEGAGLVRREVSAADARSVTVRATEEGRRVLDEGRRRRVALLTEALTGLPGADRETLADATALIENVLRQMR
jgi:DNA-binding MarR family transcriptional regulator